MSDLLELQGVSLRYGAVEALRGVSLSVASGRIVSLIGANGAGKSSLLRGISAQPGFCAGKILVDGVDITALPSDAIARLGIAHAPEGRRIFPAMSVLENLQLGAMVAPPSHFAANLARVYALFPRLAERAAQRGGTLSGGEQQMLAIGRALMAEPRLLLLDEPSLGLAPLLVKQIFAIIRSINAEYGMGILLVEQNAHQALQIADMAYVLVNGVITLSGSGQDLLHHPAVKAAYL